MGIFDIFRARGHPKRTGGKTVLTIRAINGMEAWCPAGYTRLSDAPEIRAGIRTIAELMSVMPIHLMRNTGNGNIRQSDELEKKLDIKPCKYLSRPQWITKIVEEMLISGNSYAIPLYKGRLLEDIMPINTAGLIDSTDDGGYEVSINGVTYAPDEILHFAYNADPSRPWDGRGLTLELKSVVNAVAQARTTSKAIMENPMPTVAIRVEGLDENLKTPEGRGELYKHYVSASKEGHPWLLSAENFELQQIKPMSLNDLAIKDEIEINTRTAAAIIGVPSFILGVGEFKQAEYNNFISRRLMPIAVLIQQELTRKLLFSPDLFFRFSNRQLYSYTLEERMKLSTAFVDRGILSVNEVREDFDWAPIEGGDEHKVLENYIPIDMSGLQKKLKGEE